MALHPRGLFALPSGPPPAHRWIKAGASEQMAPDLCAPFWWLAWGYERRPTTVASRLHVLMLMVLMLRPAATAGALSPRQALVLRTRQTALLLTIGAHCCEVMAAQIDHRCEQHPDPFDCPGNLIYRTADGDLGPVIYDTVM